jgi:hypothetical protein
MRNSTDQRRKCSGGEPVVALREHHHATAIESPARSSTAMLLPVQSLRSTAQRNTRKVCNDLGLDEIVLRPMRISPTAIASSSRAAITINAVDGAAARAHREPREPRARNRARYRVESRQAPDPPGPTPRASQARSRVQAGFAGFEKRSSPSRRRLPELHAVRVAFDHQHAQALLFHVVSPSW